MRLVGVGSLLVLPLLPQLLPLQLCLVMSRLLALLLLQGSDEVGTQFTGKKRCARRVQTAENI